MGIRSSAAPWRLASTGLALLVAACASTRPAASPEVARSEVLDAEQRWWRAVSRGDVDHALTKFSSDTIFETPDGAQLRGRVALGERLRRDGRDRIEVLGTPEHVHIDSPELVVVTGTGQWTGMASDPRPPTTIRYIDTWRWTGSAWRLVSAATGPVSESSAGTRSCGRSSPPGASGTGPGSSPCSRPATARGPPAAARAASCAGASIPSTAAGPAHGSTSRSSSRWASASSPASPRHSPSRERAGPCATPASTSAAWWTDSSPTTGTAGRSFAGSRRSQPAPALRPLRRARSRVRVRSPSRAPSAPSAPTEPAQPAPMSGADAAVE